MLAFLVALAIHYDLTIPDCDFRAATIRYDLTADIPAEKPKPVAPSVKLIAFTAEWCGPCRAHRDELTALAKSHGVKIYDADRDVEAFHECGITVVPLYRVIRDGKIVLDTADFPEFEQAVKSSYQHAASRRDADVFPRR